MRKKKKNNEIDCINEEFEKTRTFSLSSKTKRVICGRKTDLKTRKTKKKKKKEENGKYERSLSAMLSNGYSWASINMFHHSTYKNTTKDQNETKTSFT